ncbi:MAG TPA: hypothetical protein VK920_05740 [Solirubrobacterales bacterium]|nr:hypothetical protein [Solirubrobacterales bacterium]
MSDFIPENALDVLTQRLRAEDSVITPHVRSTDAAPALGLLVAAGPRASAAPGEYALVVESIREGYLLHYADPRVVVGADGDLALLAGDYLYARGLERLAALEDLEAVRELSDLISLSAQVHVQDDGDSVAEALWLASAVAVAAGGGHAHDGAKAAVREDGADPRAALLSAARSGAERAGIADALTTAADSVGLAFPDVPDDRG